MGELYYYTCYCVVTYQLSLCYHTVSPAMVLTLVVTSYCNLILCHLCDIGVMLLYDLGCRCGRDVMFRCNNMSRVTHCYLSFHTFFSYLPLSLITQSDLFLWPLCCNTWPLLHVLWCGSSVLSCISVYIRVQWTVGCKSINTPSCSDTRLTSWVKQCTYTHCNKTKIHTINNMRFTIKCFSERLLTFDKVPELCKERKDRSVQYLWNYWGKCHWKTKIRLHFWNFYMKYSSLQERTNPQVYIII